MAGNPASYLGVDIEPGPSVDAICDVADLVTTYGPAFDIVITTEMVEHVRDWRGAFRNLAGVLAPGGLLVVTTRSRGFPLHFGPLDWWRYEPEDMARIAASMDIVALEPDPLAPGVFLAARVTGPLDLDVALYSMVCRRRVLDVTDADVRRFSWTEPRMLWRKVPAPLRRTLTSLLGA